MSACTIYRCDRCGDDFPSRAIGDMVIYLWWNPSDHAAQDLCKRCREEFDAWFCERGHSPVVGRQSYA